MDLIRKQNAFGCEIHWYSRIYNWPKLKTWGGERGRDREKERGREGKRGARTMKVA